MHEQRFAGGTDRGPGVGEYVGEYPGEGLEQNQGQNQGAEPGAESGAGPGAQLEAERVLGQYSIQRFYQEVRVSLREDQWRLDLDDVVIGAIGGQEDAFLPHAVHGE